MHWRLFYQSCRQREASTSHSLSAFLGNEPSLQPCSFCCQEGGGGMNTSCVVNGDFRCSLRIKGSFKSFEVACWSQLTLKYVKPQSTVEELLEDFQRGTCWSLCGKSQFLLTSREFYLFTCHRGALKPVPSCLNPGVCRLGWETRWTSCFAGSLSLHSTSVPLQNKRIYWICLTWDSFTVKSA